LRALGVGADDEVITVANAGVPPVAAIRQAGAVPRFVDVSPGSLLMDAAALAAAIRPNTRCILLVHLYGQPAPVDEIVAVARAHGLLVVEDCAHAHGARYRDRHVGTFGDVGCFSFYPTKNLAAFGDAGMCVANDAALAGRLRELRMYGYRGDGIAHADGQNSRLDELQAAILRVKLAHLADDVATRQRLARAYTAALGSAGWAVPLEADGASHAFHLYVVQTDDRAGVTARLTRAGVGFGLHYPVAVHRMPAYRDLPSVPASLPVTEAAAARVLSLPLYPQLPEGDLHRVTGVLLGG
jgi:dTDP-4-amino-4,6-dideoxygalactose transaminase